MIRVTCAKSLSRTIHAFLFGFSYYGVLKIRFVPSRILQMFCISFHTTRINPVPTNVDITRRYSILSPVECEGRWGENRDDRKVIDGRFIMKKFLIEPHGRLQEWVADEKGYFKDEGLDYDLLNSYATAAAGYALVQSTETAAPEVKRGAFENMERGRAADISCACHWAVNMASSTGHGQMWGHAYSVTPSAIVVPPESPIKKAHDLAQVEVGVGY